MPLISDATTQATLLSRARVLVIDDLPDTRDRICTALGPFVKTAIPCAPDEARSAVKFGESRIDLVLCDLRFPPEAERGKRAYSSYRGFDHGLQLLRELGSDCPPSTIMTGSVSSLDFARLQSRAVSDDGVPAARFVLKSAGIKIVMRINFRRAPVKMITLSSLLKRVKSTERQNQESWNGKAKLKFNPLIR